MPARAQGSQPSAPAASQATAGQGRGVPPAGSKAPFLAVCGHTNLDVQLQVRELPAEGRSTPVLERHVARGGNGANIAVHAASLGVRTRLWSRVGGDFPADWRSDLERLGVDLSFFVADERARTPTCYVFTDPLGRQAFAIDQGPMSAMAESPPPAELVAGMAPGAWLHLATGDPLAYAQIAAAAADAGVHVALDPGQEFAFRYDARSLEGLLSFCRALFVNEPELRVACSLLGAPSAEALLGHVPVVVVTRAAKGASLFQRGRSPVHRPAVPVPRLVDPTGAGDALRSGWYAALARGEGLEAALDWGQAAAAFTVARMGSQEHPVTRGDLDGLLARARATP